MKKGTFRLAFVGLILANLFVYACQKGDSSSTLASPTVAKEVIAGDRNAGVCEEIHIGNGNNLIICGVDEGTDCMMCGGANYSSRMIMGNNVTLPFANSDEFYLCNPTGSPISVSLSFNCILPPPPPVTVIPPLSVRYFKVVVVNGCCTAIPHPNCI